MEGLVRRDPLDVSVEREPCFVSHLLLGGSPAPKPGIKAQRKAIEATGRIRVKIGQILPEAKHRSFRQTLSVCRRGDPIEPPTATGLFMLALEKHQEPSSFRTTWRRTDQEKIHMWDHVGICGI